MNRFEDQFKDAFEHFEPEVDPTLWQNISRQLPSAQQVNPGASSAGKGIIANLGAKGIAALLTAAAITVLSIVYLTDKNDEPSVPKAETTNETETPSVNIPSKENEDAVEITTANPALKSDVDQKREEPLKTTSQNQLTNKTASENLPQTASTGDLIEDKGEPAPAIGSPSSRKEENAPESPVNSSSINAEKQTDKTEINSIIKPVLLVSSKGGFAPLKVTALTNQDGVAATFDFGDGSSPVKASNANHTFTEPGVYNISCLINGFTLEEKIEVIGQIPSAFSPNGDGVNDLFKINDIEDISIEIRIFNRTGKLVFSGKGRSIAWDGKTPDGQNAEAGTYLYDIFATPDGGGLYKQKGTIHLFR